MTPIQFRVWTGKAMFYPEDIDTLGVSHDEGFLHLAQDLKHDYPDADWYDIPEEECIPLQLVEENTPLKRKIFVGDILKAYRRDDNEKRKPVFSEVTYVNGCFMAFNCTWHELYRLWQSDFQVIGNKYENPEFLKQKHK